MGIVQLPVWRVAGSAERIAFRSGLARQGVERPSLRLVRAGAPVAAYCSACAAPINFGAVWRGDEAYCSVECSLGGNRPA
jgi:hypothetical protein